MSKVKRYTSAVFILMLCISLFASGLQLVLAQPAYTMNYQGKLTDNNGLAVPDGTYALEFKLYTQASGGSAIWTETRTGGNEVTVTNGLFSVMLGSVNSLSGVNFNQTLYLGVKVESDAEMTPRKVLGTVPSSFEARQLGGVASTSFLRSDQADSASSLLTFNGGLIATASSSLSRLSFTNATGTSLFIGGDRITDFVGTGLVLSGTTLTASLGTDITAAEIADGDHGFFSYASGVASLDTGGLTSSNLSAALTNETGTGNVVFSDAPTITGTADFVAGDFSSTLTMSGSAANIALGSNFLSGDGGDEGIFVDGSGNVGIGTTTPAGRLSVVGDARISGSIYNSALTSGRVPYVTTNSVITDSSKFTWNQSVQTLTLGGFSSGDNGRLQLATASVAGYNDITLAAPSGGIGDAGSYTATFPEASGNVVLDSATQTLTNKTISSGTIGSNTISSGATWTTAGTLTIGDGGDRIDISSNTWDVTNGVITNVTSYNGLVVTANTGVVTTGTWQGSAIGIAYGGLGAAFTDPNADQLMFFDDSLGAITGISTLSGLSISGTTLTVNDVTCTDCLTSTEIADEYVFNTGDSISGNLSFSGTAANIVLGSNYLSGDGGDEGIFVAANGNVGIGTTSPISLFALEATDPIISLSDTTSQGGIFQLRNGALRTGVFDIYDVDNSTSMITIEPNTVGSDGMVMIGTSTNNIPSNNSRLFVYGGPSGGNIDAMGDYRVAGGIGDQANIEAEGADWGINGNTNSISIRYFGNEFPSGLLNVLGPMIPNTGILDFGTASSSIIATKTTTPIQFGVDNIEIMRTTSTGLGVGTTTPWGRLSASTTSANPAFVARQNGAGAAGIFSGGNVGIGDTTPASLFTVGNGDLFQVNSSGQVVAGTWQGSVISSTYLDTNLILASEIDTSSELAAIVGDETGTGALVFAGSPTFTGTVSAAAATLSSTLTMSGSAANIALGSNYLSGDGGDEGVYVTAAGLVGIGTNNPQNTLDVRGDTDARYFRGAQFNLYDNDIPSAGSQVLSIYSDGDAQLDAGGNNMFFTAGQHIFMGGKVSVGSAATEGLLGVNFTSAAGGAGTNEYGAYFYVSDTGVVTSGTDNTYGQRIDFTRTGASGGVINSFGQYISATADTGGSHTLTGLYLTASGADVVEGLEVVVAAGSSGANSFGQRLTVTDTSTTGGQTIGSILALTDSGAMSSGFDITVGNEIDVSRTDATGGTLFNTGSDINVSGNFASGSGTVWNTGQIITVTGNTTGTSINTGLSVFVSGADTNYAALFDGGNVGIGDADPSSLFTVGNGDLFQVDSSGAIAASTGITSSGQLTLSGSSANIALGSNYLSGDGGDEGVSIGTTGAVTVTPATSFTAGTLISAAVGGATTLSGAYTGFNVNLSTNFTATGQNVTGQSITLPAVTNTGAGSYVYKGAEVTGGTLVQNTGAGVNQFYGLFVTNPNITQTTGAVFAQGLNVTTGTITTNGAQRGINITSSGVAAGSLDGILISGITAGAGTETALNIGSGWDTILNSATLDITGAGAITGATAITTSGNLTLSGSSANIVLGSNYLSGDGGDEGVYVTAAGLVGIGTTTPLTAFQVNSGIALTTGPTLSTNENGIVSSRNSSGSEGYSSLRLFNQNSLANVDSVIRSSRLAANAFLGLEIGTASNHDIRFLTNGLTNERMRITTAGNLGIGDTTPDARLDFDFASTNATAGNEYGSYFTVADTGVVTTGTDSTYGNRIDITRTGATGGTINTYGQYISAVGDAAGAGASTNYGVYSTASGAETNYGFYADITVAGNELASYGMRSVITDTNTIGGNSFGFRSAINDSGVITSGSDVNTGIRNNISRTGATGGTITNIGNHTIVAGTFASGSGSITNTGLDMDITGDTVGTSLNIGLDVNVTGADTNYAALFTGGNVGIGDLTPDSFLDIDAPTTLTTGTIFGASAAGATTLTGSLTGINLNLATNYTATGQSITGANITLPTTSNSSGVSAHSGIAITGNNLTSSGTGYVGFTGVSVSSSNITQTAGTAVSTGVSILTGSITTGGTQVGLNIIPSTGAAAGSLYGVSVDAITAGAGTERAINVGTGWDYGLYVASRAFVSTDTASGYAGEFFNDGNNANRYGLKVQGGADDGSGTTYYLDAYDGDGGQVGYIANTAGTFGLVDISDRRTKIHITNTEIASAGEIISALRVVDFNRKQDSDGPRITGFIAQEVNEIYPFAVTENPTTGYLGVMKEAFIPLLVKGAQEQIEINSEQEGALATLGDTLVETIRSISDLEAVVKSGLSENYRTEDSSLEAGEIVTLDAGEVATIKRASLGDKVFGVVATNPGLVLGQSDDDVAPVALSGRVPVKINLEGGDVAVGDAITLSSEPGVGTKATTTSRVVGTALESTDSEGVIEIFIEPATYFTKEAESGLASLFAPIEQDENDTLWNRLSTLATNFIDGVLTVAGVRTDELCVGSVCVDEAAFLEMVENAGSSAQAPSSGPPTDPEPVPPDEEMSDPPPQPEPDPESPAEPEVPPENNE